MMWLAAADPRRIRHASDDLVLSSGMKASDYAELSSRTATGWRQLFTRHRGRPDGKEVELENRVMRTLDTKVNRTESQDAKALCLLAAMSVVLLRR
jgi:hypothetical protein